MCPGLIHYLATTVETRAKNLLLPSEEELLALPVATPSVEAPPPLAVATPIWMLLCDLAKGAGAARPERRDTLKEAGPGDLQSKVRCYDSFTLRCL